MPADSRVTNLTGPLAHHAEGPVWSPLWGGLRYVDMMAGDLLTVREDGVDRVHVGTVAAFHRPTAAGGFVVALERGLAVSPTPDGDATTLPELWDDEDVRFNDGGTSPDGTLYGGTFTYSSTTGGGRLFRFTRTEAGTFEPETVLEAVTCSNGLAWSPDGSRAYYADTPTRRIAVLDNVEDHLVNHRFLTSVEAGAGPDGLTVDAEGGIWVAVWGAGAVHRYDPDGRLTEVIEVPPRQVSACTFGGDDLGTLFVTTSAENLTAGSDPEAGSVYAVRPGVRGLPVTPLAQL